MTISNAIDPMTPLGPELAKAAIALVRDMMCVVPGEHVLVTSDTGSDKNAVEAIVNASYLLDAKVASMMLAPPLPFQGGLANPYMPDPVVAAAQNCDAWIDLCMPYMAGAEVYDTAMKNGRTRYFLAADIGAGGIIRIFTKADLDQVFVVSDMFNALLAESAGKSCRFTTPLGTDVTFTLAAPEGLAIERATKPGGFFVPGTVMVIPDLESVKGTIVCESTFHEYYTPLEEPYRFEVDGKIQEVTGGGTELRAIKRSLKRAGNGEYGNIVHFTCGYHPAARFTGKSFIEDQRVVGCNAVGLGLPQWVDGGGENHPDCVMRNQSFWIDGEQVIDEGNIVAPPDLAKAVTDLVPVYG
jgi:2,5-dihydroxypyridine 5,6-dioxygenase